MSVRSMLSAKARACAEYLKTQIDHEKLSFEAAEEDVFVIGGETNLTITVHEYHLLPDGTNYSMSGVVVNNQTDFYLGLGQKVKMPPHVFPGKDVYRFTDLDDFKSVKKLALKYFIAPLPKKVRFDED